MAPAVPTAAQPAVTPVNTSPPTGDIHDPRVLSGYLVGGTVALVLAFGICLNAYLGIRNFFRRRQARREKRFLDQHHALSQAREQQLHERYIAALDDHAKRTAAALATISTGGDIELAQLKFGGAGIQLTPNAPLGPRPYNGPVTSLGRPIPPEKYNGPKTSLGRPILAATPGPSMPKPTNTSGFTSLGRPIAEMDMPPRPTGPVPTITPQYSTFPRVNYSPGRQRSATTVSNGSSSKLSQKSKASNSSAPPMPPLPHMDKTLAAIIAEGNQKAKEEMDRVRVPHAITVSGARHTPIVVPSTATMIAMDNSDIPTDMTNLSKIASTQRGVGTSNPAIEGYGIGASYGGSYGHTTGGYSNHNLRGAYIEGLPYTPRGHRRLT
ncbi:uncharacterized protein K452DRAFT_339575 [Aplosporella prunicola CBS 121167]|uniref:Uncharacterized protein n=1 Tax=Aplosporella prunicola CBS 121167 TaxID=1176127 RepID=A0A6A6B1H7_9PEZI|nr:uncharacterized protein K452DRAFT_339575 [Aplosporella prunicola CBS 121167]KAF2137900.1 hypothetical protein K452DRAFT_339575 [Aplosporella prunicola CBS 121167]